MKMGVPESNSLDVSRQKTGETKLTSQCPAYKLKVAVQRTATFYSSFLARSKRSTG
jgi:hypothetical protein